MVTGYTRGKMSHWSALSLLALLISVAIAAEEGERCENAPGGTVGECVLATKCGPIMALIQRDARAMSTQTLNLLHEAHCGFLPGDHPLICCPNVTAIALSVSSATSSNSSLVEVGTVSSSTSSNVGFDDPKIPILPLSSCGYSISDRITMPPNVLTLTDVRPTMVRLAYTRRNGSRVFLCGGSLICDRYVLTAAHCVSGLKNGTRLSSVVLGDFDLTTDPDCEVHSGLRFCRPPALRIAVQNITVHPEYEALSQSNDIALLRLENAVNFTSELDLIAVCLPLGEHQFREPPASRSWATWLRTSGWGTRRNGTSKFSKRLYGVVRTDNVTLCASPKFNRSAHLCVEGQRQTDALIADSGGPLMVIDTLRPEDGPRLIQIGVESFFLPSLNSTAPPPRVFTRVGPHLKWILDNIQI